MSNRGSLNAKRFSSGLKEKVGKKHFSKPIIQSESKLQGAILSKELAILFKNKFAVSKIEISNLLKRTYPKITDANIRKKIRMLLNQKILITIGGQYRLNPDL